MSNFRHLFSTVEILKYDQFKHEASRTSLGNFLTLECIKIMKPYLMASWFVCCNELVYFRELQHYKLSSYHIKHVLTLLPSPEIEHTDSSHNFKCQEYSASSAIHTSPF